MTKKLLLIPVLMIGACVMAGLYGVIHNQISYTVAPVYFHEFKFLQFGIRPEWKNRFGGALVGWQASWWMGLLLGVPISLLCLAVRGSRQFVRAFLFAALTVIAITLLTGLVGLVYAVLTIHDGNLPYWMLGRAISEPVAFARAGTMHNLTYLGGMLGLLAGAIVVIWRAVISYRTTPN